MTSRPPTDPTPQSPKVGGVWTFWAPKREDHLIAGILDTSQTDIWLVPLLADTEWAADADVALAPDVLGYEALAPISSIGWVLLEQAAEPVGMLSEQHLRLLTDAREAFQANRRVPNPAGPAILSDEDPRKDAHHARQDDLGAYFDPWALLHSQNELGPLVKDRREHFGIDLETWADELDVDARTWRAFERGEADPDATIPAKALARALVSVDVLVSLRVLELAGESVRKHHQAPEPGAAKARRRRGVRRPLRHDPEAAEHAAGRYVRALAKELGL
jgi:DNA-binding XRE family transcriptional regulator